MSEYVNNHIHTIYSFSPYSPEMAVKMAKKNGLSTAGIVDHDSIGGAKEFIAAAKEQNIGATVGFECRVDMTGTPFEGKRINNPDQKSNAYVACHGVMHRYIDKIQEWLAPYREKRNVRNRAMVQKINTLFEGTGVELSFEEDILPISMAKDGGSVTERHLCYALAKKLVEVLEDGEKIYDVLSKKAEFDAGQRAMIIDTCAQHYDYTLLGILKSAFVGKFYLDATDECPGVNEFIRFTRSIGAIPAYAYLGDVGQSVTGDKKAQKFEDEFVEELIAWGKEVGFLAVTYMPTRNTGEQLARIMKLCDEHALFQISGEDINSPTQGFRCEALKKPEFAHLITSTWALIGHESAQSDEQGMFSPETMSKHPVLNERIKVFASKGREKQGGQ